jgi:hypothetical protein
MKTYRQCYFSKEISCGTHRMTQNSVGGGGFFQEMYNPSELLEI